jgi:hypothetical protein
MKYKQLSLADTCRHLFDELKAEKGDVGIIALNKEGESAWNLIRKECIGPTGPATGPVPLVSTAMIRRLRT